MEHMHRKPHKGAAMRTELDVPFLHKDEAKALGAKWDRAKKIWYVPDGVNPEPFAAWLPGVDRSDPSAPYIYLVLGKRECWKCHEQTTVAAFGIPYLAAEDSSSKAAPSAAPAMDDACHDIRMIKKDARRYFACITVMAGRRVGWILSRSGQRSAVISRPRVSHR